MTQPFLLVDATDDPFRFTLSIDARLCVGPEGRQFMFGGVGLATAVAAMEAASGRPALWATAHYIAYARPGTRAEISVSLPAQGKSITQARATLVDEGREILTASAALGARESLSGQWSAMPDVPGWDACEEYPHWNAHLGVSGRFRFRPARGVFADKPPEGSTAKDGRLCLWIAPAEADVAIDRVLLAVIADFLSPGIRNATGRRTGGNSLDNTIRYGTIVPTRCVLCDITIETIASGIVHGSMRIFAEDGTLMAVASQSMILRVRN